MEKWLEAHEWDIGGASIAQCGRNLLEMRVYDDQRGVRIAHGVQQFLDRVTCA